MSLHLDIPDHLLISLLKKLDAVSFTRLLRASKWVYTRASNHRKSIRIDLNSHDYEPPSRRRQMVFIYTGEEDKQKILFPKNFAVFLEQTIPDLAFFRFGRIIFSHRHSDWDKELMVEMLAAMKSNGFSCQTLVNEVPIMLEETIRSLRPLELAVLQPYDITGNVQQTVLKTLKSVECVPGDTGNILEAIAILTKFCVNTTIWAHNVQEDDLKARLLPKLDIHLREVIETRNKTGQLNLYVSNANRDPFLEMLFKLGAQLFHNESQTTVAFLSAEDEGKLAVILFEDFNDVPYTMLHYKFVGGLEQFKEFYNEIVREEAEEDNGTTDFWADIRAYFSQ